MNTAKDARGPRERKVEVAELKAGIFRARAVPGEVERQFASLMGAMKKEIRSRHYSIRTESACTDWARRFIAFHGYADPRNLDATKAVKEYIERLAVERSVAANTQNQALNALVVLYNNVLNRSFGELETFVRARTVYEEDRGKGVPGVYVWPALARKYPKAALEWKWQYVFPAKGLSVDQRSAKVQRHHISETLVQDAVKEAAERARHSHDPGIAATR
jgi:hypothetical protein